jgi:hypothetical protein
VEKIVKQKQITLPNLHIRKEYMTFIKVLRVLDLYEEVHENEIMYWEYIKALAKKTYGTR